jgi:hypothetical protein
MTTPAQKGAARPRGYLDQLESPFQLAEISGPQASERGHMA